MIDYSNTARIARYAFTFWTFPREYWVENLKAYFNFRDEHFERTGFRCNLPLGSYFVRKDQSSVLSYSFDGDMFSLDPIHAPASNDREAWWRFLREFNEWAAPRRGRPLLNQSPFVTREQVEAAYGVRWARVSDWARSLDTGGRMRNQFFADLLADPVALSG
jgi:hypothetical protein